MKAYTLSSNKSTMISWNLVDQIIEIEERAERTKMGRKEQTGGEDRNRQVEGLTKSKESACRM